MTPRVEKLFSFLKEHPEYNTTGGIFNTRNITGDRMETIYWEDNRIVNYCPGYDYLEVFGMTDEEFKEFSNSYYDVLNIELPWLYAENSWL